MGSWPHPHHEEVIPAASQRRTTMCNGSIGEGRDSEASGSPSRKIIFANRCEQKFSSGEISLLQRRPLQTPQCPQAGDVVHQRLGIVRGLFDYSPDMEGLEIVSPADSKTVGRPPTTDNVLPVTSRKSRPARINRKINLLEPLPGAVDLGAAVFGAPHSHRCRYLAVNSGVQTSAADSGAVRSSRVPFIKMPAGRVAFWHNGPDAGRLLMTR